MAWGMGGMGGNRVNIDGSAVPTPEILQRSTGTGRVTFKALGAHPDGPTRTVVDDLEQAGCVRIRLPRPEPGAAPSAVLINTAGGLADGDTITLSAAWAPGTMAAVTSQAAERVYRARAGAGVLPARIDTRLDVSASATALWLPQETILFDGACAQRTIDINLDATASLVLCEIVVFGRAAMGEMLKQGSFVDRWRVRRGGKLVFAETVRLDGDIAATLARSAVAKGGAAIGTALIVPGDEVLAERIRAASGSFSGEVGISAWNGFAMVRVCAQNASQARADMMIALRAANVALPRLWMS